MAVVFVHGVPDTPFMWSPLTTALGLGEADVHAPALPGFGNPLPKGFPATKEAYTDWLIEQIEPVAAANGGQVDIVGHDWGALLTLRVCSLRPDLFRSFVVANALIDPEYTGHSAARMWATPVLGEISMFAWQFLNVEKGLADAGMPPEIAAHDAGCFNGEMRRAILKLYRSAAGLNFRGSWVDDLANLPKNGLVLWGENDPFVGMDVADRFTARWGYPLHVIKDTGHWGIIERPEESAGEIKAFWASL